MNAAHPHSKSDSSKEMKKKYAAFFYIDAAPNPSRARRGKYQFKGKRLMKTRVHQSKWKQW